MLDWLTKEDCKHNSIMQLQISDINCIIIGALDMRFKRLKCEVMT